jgi:hypothetical protein
LRRQIGQSFVRNVPSTIAFELLSHRLKVQAARAFAEGEGKHVRNEFGDIVEINVREQRKASVATQPLPVL